LDAVSCFGRKLSVSMEEKISIIAGSFLSAFFSIFFISLYKSSEVVFLPTRLCFLPELKEPIYDA